ncbi:hypothetical protein J437_LFUL013172 [Ladona fulva]|uniref:Dihydropteridine reductase n=1 Tax=Ladona fulva TaxID=123851 RepID=A0A8K0P521_LADFU|nr:hypothetical protein J437_LFUL013172 [Ladona fulva]
MWRQSVWSAAIAASIAVKNLKEGGLVTLPGAKPALGPTPGMIGYGMAKAAVHQLTKSLAAEKSGLPPNCLTVAILPVTLDTPMNRKWMPNADFSTWTPLEFVAEALYYNRLLDENYDPFNTCRLFLRWSRGEDRPPNGSLVQMVTKNFRTELLLA